MRITIIELIVIINLILLSSCFPEDEAQPLVPFKGLVGSTKHSIYTHQSFYSLTNSNEATYNSIEDWDLGFENGDSGEHIIINSGKSLYIANLGPVDFNSTQTLPDDTEWIYDASAGPNETLAINNWINTNSAPYKYSNNVYVLAKREGPGKYNPIKKLTFIALTDSSYTMKFANLDATESSTYTLHKEATTNYSKIIFKNDPQTAHIEPQSTDWDLQFTQYASIIPDDNGTPTPYLLRGTLINDKNISVAQYYISEEEVASYTKDATYEQTLLKNYFESELNSIPKELVFSSDWDAIGYEWKKVTIDEEANTAVYKADTRRVYFIKNVHTNKTYKLRFFSYYSNGERGYPWFQFIEL